MMRKFIFFFVWLLCVSLPVLAQETQDDPQRRAVAEAFIASLADRVINQLNDPAVAEQARLDTFAKAYAENFDSQRIPRLVLARYWNVATPLEQRDFVELFKESNMRLYRNKLKNYRGQKLQVVSSRLDGTGQYVLVDSRVIDPVSNEAVALEWRVQKGSDGMFRIVDVGVEGISMILTLRSEYAAVIERNGGKVAPLLEEMRRKTYGEAAKN
ncbi:MAG: phospholipid-binding protein MlaC [Holosporales bacterium]